MLFRSWPYRGWMALGHALGWVNGHLILGAVFVLVLQPIALLMRLCGYDPLRRRRCLKKLAARVGFRPALRFIYVYVIRGGFLDGYPGLVFSLLRVAQEAHITAKLAEAAAIERGMPRDHGL